uniref:Uncharacterized protein n=1 Tax=Myotis myotis TaxID=51298 RepID=A0A7J7WHY1_MYOMY|nr:hypothetical protein mMyoMyo1_012155 [Myotis myotis]
MKQMKASADWRMLFHIGQLAEVSQGSPWPTSSPVQQAEVETRSPRREGTLTDTPRNNDLPATWAPINHHKYTQSPFSSTCSVPWEPELERLQRTRDLQHSPCPLSSGCSSGSGPADIGSPLKQQAWTSSRHPLSVPSATLQMIMPDTVLPPQTSTICIPFD